MPANPLTPSALAESAKLKSLFKEWQDIQKQSKLPSSQESAAAELGFGQSAMNQYLNGGIPLNVEAAVAFAKLLEVKIDKFSPTIAERIRLSAQLVDGNRNGPGLSIVRRQPRLILAWDHEESLLDAVRRTDERGQDEILEYAVGRSITNPARAAGDQSKE